MRGATSEACGLPAVERAEFGHGCDQERSEDGGDAWDGSHGASAGAEVAVLVDELLDLNLDGADTVFEIGDMVADVVGDEMPTRGLEAIGFLALHGDEIEAS